MIDKKHESSKKGLCCSSKLHLIVIIVLAALLGISGYFDWQYYQFYTDYKSGLLGVSEELANKLVSGTIVNISGDTITVATNLTQGKKNIKINSGTTIKGVQTNFNHVSAEEMEKLQNQQLTQKDLKVGDNIQVLLVGTIKDKELVAKEITVTK